jgi:hypothetical protein
MTATLEETRPFASVFCRHCGEGFLRADLAGDHEAKCIGIQAADGRCASCGLFIYPDGLYAGLLHGEPCRCNVKPILKLDIGCGGNKRQDNGPWIGVDCLQMIGVDVVADLRETWPWEDGSVTEIHASHVLEHFGSMQRVHIANEMYRVLMPGGKATVIVPHWASCRAYGDPTHQWPPCGEFWFYYLSREWRLGNADKKIPANAPHTDAKYLEGGFNCDFEATWGYTPHPHWQTRSAEAQQFAFQFNKEAIQDMISTWTARK